MFTDADGTTPSHEGNSRVVFVYGTVNCLCILSTKFTLRVVGLCVDKYLVVKIVRVTLKWFWQRRLPILSMYSTM